MSEFRVENMSCAHCRRAVEEAVRAVDPAAEVAVDLERGRVRVTSAAPAGRIAAAIATGGYPAEAVA